MKRPKLTVRPTAEEHEKLHELAEALGYRSLSAYLIDCGMCEGGVLPRERRTLESLLLHVRHLAVTVEEERRKREAGILSPVSPASLNDITRRAAESVRLINLILNRATTEEAKEAA